jgi:glycosyltransferase involved in cell wall biosynthesis
MRILWLTWKDGSHPRAGGAEVVNEELAKRLAKDGHEVTFLVAGFENAAPEEKHDGFSIVRLGNRYSVYWRVYRYYKKHLSDWPDLVIDEMNTIPFFAKYYVRQKNIMFIHQLCREIWFYQMFFPLSLVGYLLEPVYLWLLSDREVVTVSESTKKDLMRFGFREGNVHIISEGIDIEPVPELAPKNLEQPMILALGRCDPMKRTADILKAFELVKKELPTAQLVIAGLCDGRYGREIKRMREASRSRDSITITGIINKDRKISLLRDAAVLVSTSVKEGWGLVVTEANSQGTPAVVYNADGLRDSVKAGETGIVCKNNTSQALATNIEKLLSDQDQYTRLRTNAWEWSKKMTFEKSYAEFARKINQHY